MSTRGLVGRVSLLLTALDLSVKLVINIYGAAGTRETNTDLSGLECPFELPH